MFFACDYKKKAISCALLIILLLIHSIRLLHSHSNIQIAAGTDSSPGGVDLKHQAEIVKSFQDCTICSYQPARDADDKSFLPGDFYHKAENIFLPAINIITPVSFPASFESRGPPCAV